MREDLGLMDLKASQIWNAVTMAIGILLGFRTRQALSRFWEGTGLLHQMRGEWFDTVSNCVTFSIDAKKKKPTEVMKFRHTIVRLMSLAHGSALEEIAGDQVQLETIDIFGLDTGTLRHLKECHDKYKFNKVEVMLHLVQSLITDAHTRGIVTVPPPILSRVYQTISRGFVNLLNAKKITDTRFPFPYAQLIAFLLIALTFLTPLMLSALLKSKILIALFCFIPIFGLFSMNFIAIELENPFGIDTNDLPLQHFQDEMNSCLLMLLHDNTDLIAETSPDCMMDFQALYKEMCPHLAGITETFDQAELSRRKTRLSDFKDERNSTTDEEGTISICAVSTLEPEARTTVTQQTSLKQPSDKATVVSIDAPPRADAKKVEQPHASIGSRVVVSGAATGADKKDSEPKDFPKEPTAELVRPGLPKNVTDAGQINLQETPRLDSAAKASDMQPLIDKSMDNFNRSMQRWTEIIDSQVGELHRNCHALQRFNDSLTAMRPDAHAWAGAMPGV